MQGVLVERDKSLSPQIMPRPGRGPLKRMWFQGFEKGGEAWDGGEVCGYGTDDEASGASTHSSKESSPASDHCIDHLAEMHNSLRTLKNIELPLLFSTTWQNTTQPPADEGEEEVRAEKRARYSDNSPAQRAVTAEQGAAEEREGIEKEREVLREEWARLAEEKEKMRSDYADAFAKMQNKLAVDLEQTDLIRREWQSALTTMHKLMQEREAAVEQVDQMTHRVEALEAEKQALKRDKDVLVLRLSSSLLGFEGAHTDAPKRLLGGAKAPRHSDAPPRLLAPDFHGNVCRTIHKPSSSAGSVGRLHSQASAAKTLHKAHMSV